MRGVETPLRFPGGKSRLAPFIQGVCEYNGLVGAEYVEPYAGGAGVAVKFLLEGKVSGVHINDVDRSVWAFWYSVKFEPEALCRRIRDCRVDMPTWHRMQEIRAQEEEADPFELGFSTLFLSRCNYSGILRGGVLGGKRQAGKYKLDCRFNKDDLISRIEQLATRRGEIRVTRLDAMDVIAQAPEGAFLYIDPPFVHKAPGLYTHFYEESNHKDLASLLSSGKVKANWVVSYDQCDFIEELYGFCKKPLYWYHYSTFSKRRSTPEVIFCSPGLKFPGIAPFRQLKHTSPSELALGN